MESEAVLDKVIQFSNRVLKETTFVKEKRDDVYCAFERILTSAFDDKDSLVFCYVLNHLIEKLTANCFSDRDEELAFDELLFRGPPQDVFLALVHAFLDSSPSYKQEKLIDVLKKYLQRSRMSALVIGQCSAYGNDITWIDLASQIISLPDKAANRLKAKTPRDLQPDRYLTYVTSALMDSFSFIQQQLEAGKSASVKFPSMLLGKLCASGHAEHFGTVIPKMLQLGAKNFVYRRVCTRIIGNVPDSCLECVAVPILCCVPKPDQVDWFLGDSVTSQEKLKYILTTKLLLIRIFEEDRVLKNIIGYLALCDSRRELFFKSFKSVLDCWGNKVAMKHQSLSQQFYLSRALIVFVKYLKKFTLVKRDEIMNSLLHGVQNHIASPEISIRTYGMVVAENMTKVLKVEKDGPDLKFEYDRTPDVEHLISLLLDNNDEDETTKEIRPYEEVTGKTTTTTSVIEVLTQDDLDSDDDLVPYDMSHDVPSKLKRPAYLRDCMQGLLEQDKDDDWFEACLESVPDLVQKHHDEVEDVATELAKILLHLEEKPAIPKFSYHQHRSLVSLTVAAPKLVADYLTDQFYKPTFNIRQRLDILEVLAVSSNELSKPIPSLKNKTNTALSYTDTPSIAEKSWKEIVQERINKKTKRLNKGKVQEQEITKNRFSDVAGSFFFPLMRYYDRPENTFDLLGEDNFVLGRLIYTLGVILHSAENTVACRRMAYSLLEFLWTLRYNVEAYVREAILFAFSMIVTSIPGHMLVNDMRTEVLEFKCWLEHLVEKDPSEVCKQRALQLLKLLGDLVQRELSDTPKS